MNFGGPSTLNKLKFGKYTFHLHHWIIHLLLFMYYKIIFLKHKSSSKCAALQSSSTQYNDFVLGILFGGILHGLLEYNDSFRIIY